MGAKQRRCTVDSGCHTYVLLACALVGDLGGHNADKDTYFVACLVDLVVGPIDPLQGGLCDNI